MTSESPKIATGSQNDYLPVFIEFHYSLAILKLDTNCKKMNIFEKISLKNLFQLSTKKIVHHKLKEEIDDDLTREDLPLVSKDQGHELYINQHITDKIGYFGKIIMRK